MDNKLETVTKGKPVLLVHGISGPSIFIYKKGIDQEKALDNNTEIAEIKATFQNMPEWLRKDGFEVYFATYLSNYIASPSIESRSEVLGKEIVEIALKNPGQKLTIIAHSLGGYITRAYIDSLMYSRDKKKYFNDEDFIDKVFFLATPHLGMPHKRLATKFLDLTNNDYYYAAEEFLDTTYLNIFNKEFVHNNQNIDYYTIGGIQCSNFVGKVFNSMTAMKWGTNDGICPTFSAIGLENVVQSAIVNESHSSIFGNSYFDNKKDGSYSEAYKSCIRPVIVDGDRFGCKGNIQKYRNRRFDLFTPLAIIILTIIISLSPSIRSTRRIIRRIILIRQKSTPIEKPGSL